MNKITRQIQTFLMKKNDLSIQQVLLLLMKCLMYYKECYVYLIKQQYKENQTRIHHVFHQMNELMNRITHSIIDFSTVSSLLIDFWFFLSHSSVVFFHSIIAIVLHLYRREEDHEYSILSRCSCCVFCYTIACMESRLLGTTTTITASLL